MVGKQSPTFTQVELEFMHVMWDAGKELKAEDFVERFAAQDRPLKGGTVRTMLQRLIMKGFATRRPKGRGHLYRPLLTRKQGREQMVLDLLQRAFDGDEALMLGALVESRQGRHADMKQIKKLLRKSGARKKARSR
jgi:predicted transcriptional regulator